MYGVPETATRWVGGVGHGVEVACGHFDLVLGLLEDVGEHERLVAAVRTLASGGSVGTEDGEVEIAHLRSAPSIITLSVRDAQTPGTTTRLALRPYTVDELATRRQSGCIIDSRGPVEDWRALRTDTPPSIWELFNVCIITLGF